MSAVGVDNVRRKRFLAQKYMSNVKQMSNVIFFSIHTEKRSRKAISTFMADIQL